MVPLVIPPVIAAYSVIGERDQGTLEPFLTTPVRRDELLLGKAVAAFVPSVAVAHAIYVVFLVAVRLGAAHAISAVVWHAPQMLAQILFTPLLAVWSIWVGIAMSARAGDVRVAQQLATLASLPALGFTTLVSFQVIEPSVPLAIGLALVLVAIDVAAWRVVSRMFDRAYHGGGARGRQGSGSPLRSAREGRPAAAALGGRASASPSSPRVRRTHGASCRSRRGAPRAEGSIRRSR